MTVNDTLMQMQADLLDIDVECVDMPEITALGWSGFVKQFMHYAIFFLLDICTEK